MSMASSSSYSISLLLILLSLLCCYSFVSTTAQSLAPGLSFTFYESTCPQVESIVRDRLRVVFEEDIGQAAGLLRLQFHDCFVLGCDGSLLLEGSAGGPGERGEIPNLSLRPEAFRIIEDLRSLVHEACGQVVSCSDITALAARDSVALSGGPDFAMPLGRRDGLSVATEAEVLGNLVAPTSTTPTILDSLATKGFDTVDVVALSGAHTIGRGNCSSFENRLFPTQDPEMDLTFGDNLRLTCPAQGTINPTVLDLRSPSVFDNRYYVDLTNREGLFTSDQDLFTNLTTRDVVTSFAENQTLFFESFVAAMIKMRQLNLTTGTQGEIRANCSVRNSDNMFLRSFAIEGEGEGKLSAF